MVPVVEVSSLTPCALGDLYIGSPQSCGVELHELHVLQRHSCPIGKTYAKSLVDDGIGGFLIDTPVTTGGKNCCLCSEYLRFGIEKVHCHKTKTPFVFNDKSCHKPFPVDLDTC